MFDMVILQFVCVIVVFLFEGKYVMQIEHPCEIRQEIYFIEFYLLDLDYL